MVLYNRYGDVNWTVTNHGQFRSENDSIVMFNRHGGGSHTIVNDGTIGTSVQPSGGAGAFIYAPSSTATGMISNNGGFVYATGNGREGDVGGLAVFTGGNATIYNNPVEGVGGYVRTAYDAALLALSTDGNALVDGRYGTVTASRRVRAMAWGVTVAPRASTSTPAARASRRARP